MVLAPVVAQVPQFIRYEIAHSLILTESNLIVLREQDRPRVAKRAVTPFLYLVNLCGRPVVGRDQFSSISRFTSSCSNSISPSMLSSPRNREISM